MQWNFTTFRDADVLTPETTVETCWNAGGGCGGVGDGRVSAASRVAGPAPDASGLVLYVDCNPGPCAPGSARVTLHRLDARLSDRFDPTLVGAPSGDLLEPGRALAGVRSVAFSATDRGGGVYTATLEVDGAAAVTQVVDGNGGRCREPFTTPVPCRLTASGSIALDTARLADGVHRVRLVVADATRTNTVAYGPVEITTRNQSPGCDPAITRATTPVTLRFRGTRSRHLTRRRGGGGRVAGTVAGAAAGTSVFVVARAIRTGARERVAARAQTAADGSFRVKLPRGVSRRLRAGIRVRPTDALLACSRPLELRTPARATLARADRARPRPARRPAARRARPRARQGGRAAGARARELADLRERHGRPPRPLQRRLPVLGERARARVPDARPRPARGDLPVRARPLAGRARPRQVSAGRSGAAFSTRRPSAVSATVFS